RWGTVRPKPNKGQVGETPVSRSLRSLIYLQSAPKTIARDSRRVSVVGDAGQCAGRPPHGNAFDCRRRRWNSPERGERGEGEFQEIARVPNKPTMPVTKRVSTCDASAVAPLLRLLSGSPD